MSTLEGISPRQENKFSSHDFLAADQQPARWKLSLQAGTVIVQFSPDSRHVAG
jgi:hypothetical protein